MWKTDQKLPTDYLTLLYEDENQQEMDVEDEEEKQPFIKEEPKPPAAGPGRPQEDDLQPDLRDRSPLRPIYSKRGRKRGKLKETISSPLESLEQPSESIDGDVRIRLGDENLIETGSSSTDTEFLTPDAHTLYPSPEEHDVDVSNGRKERRGGRKSGRGLRGRRARGGRGQSDRSQPNQWKSGDPLNEIWTDDLDVPGELVSLAKDVIRKRYMRRQDAARAEREDASGSEDEDNFQDATDGSSDLPRLEGPDLRFDWFPMHSYQGSVEEFQPKRTGPVHEYNSAYDAFRSFWDDDIINRIVAETNSYATTITSRPFQKEWIPTNSDEILCLFAFWMMLGIIKMPTIISCFSADPLLETNVFKRIFTRKRYEMLARALYFVESDPASNDLNPCNTTADHFKPIVDHLNFKFQTNYVPDQNVYIVESSTFITRSLDYKSSYGIKTFELCESITGYLWSFLVYTDEKSLIKKDLEQSSGVLKSVSIVKKLMTPLFNKGYRLFMDSWFNSPHLARLLKRNGTDCVGILNPARKDVPLVLSQTIPLKRGEFVARHSGDVTLLAWQDQNRTTLISTCHGSSAALPTVESRPTPRPVPFKPQVVLDYNKFMGATDSKDQMFEPYLLERKSGVKCYMKLFKRLLNISIVNSSILVQSSTQTYQQHDLPFRLQLVDAILTNHLSHCPLSNRPATFNRSAHSLPGRFTDSTHWPEAIKATEGYYATQKHARKLCVSCRQKKTTYSCMSCHVPLCILNCFMAYHTAPS